MSQWISDRSSECVINTNIVTHRSDEQGDNVFNYLWLEGDGVSSGKHYWKIHFETLENGGGVGLTSREHFKKGYACKGLKYLGNLSDGAGLLVMSFGPSPSAGDVIGILADFCKDRLKVYIDINGKSLGLAFDVPATTFKSIFPFVSFSKSGSATCTKQSEIPNITDRAPTPFSDIQGDWKLSSVQENGDRLKLQSSPTCKIRKEDANTYSWFVKVANNVSTRLSNEGGNWKTSHVLSTRMLGPPELMKLERTISALMEGLKDIKIEANGHLSAKSENTLSAWTRYDSTPQAFVGSIF